MELDSANTTPVRVPRSLYHSKELARAEICLFHADVPRDFLENYPVLLEFHRNRLKQTRKEIFVVKSFKYLERIGC